MERNSPGISVFVVKSRALKSQGKFRYASLADIQG